MVRRAFIACLLVACLLSVSIFAAGCLAQKTRDQKETEDNGEANGSLPSKADAEEPAVCVYYVATDGNDDNAGTIEAPWKTIQKAADTVKAGDTVCVRGGTYHEKVEMKTSGTDGAYITFESCGEEVAVIDGESIPVRENDEENALIIVSDKSYIRIKGFCVTNYVSTNEYVPAGIRLSGSGQHIEILGCTVCGIKTTYTGAAGQDRNAHGISVYGTNGEAPLDSVVIDGCEVYDNMLGWSESVVLNGNVTNFRVTNNKIHDNDNIGIDFIGFEETAPYNDQARNGICSGNEVWNISSANNGAYDDICADGIYVDGGKSIVIERNKVWNCDIGIEVASEHAGRITENITIRNNVIYGCKAVAGLAFGGYDEERGGAENIRITNNTLYDNEPQILIQYDFQSDTNVIRNNIFYKGTDFEGDSENILISHNVTEDPAFVNEEKADFHLADGSPAIDTGLNDEFTGDLDMDNHDRVSGDGIDCGAYESRAE